MASLGLCSLKSWASVPCCRRLCSTDGFPWEAADDADSLRLMCSPLGTNTGSQPTSMSQFILRRYETSAVWSFARGLGQEGVVMRMGQLIELHDRGGREYPLTGAKRYSTSSFTSPEAHLFHLALPRAKG